ncbi:class I SAM-dependent methyltransferase [Vulgatibacter incomptus]|uniref:23S rRNA (Guanine-N-2-)-methyltransferase rlmL n=1 Tax=Vulgatibacter incomptus TaxID=1391653 RepID=A0A0K1PI82_9BACT|nr:class I SAM-dependent methyltransferase [Vulgatibacter incomptus]AKU92819.1 23S rRNA (guanine-N-2-) -methyltransferase rlmL [Vulgatibacter incomptus]
MAEPSEKSSPFANRLRKVAPQRMRQAARQGLTAFRLYDSDIPEYRFMVDWYGGHVHVVELAGGGFTPAAQREARAGEVRDAIRDELGVPPERIHWKTKAPKVWGQQQYEKLGSGGERVVVEEGGLRFWVNLDDYIDTGLFLDHRLTRARVGDEARGKRFLNLFCYTGSFTVYAAAGGASETTSVDLSNTYLDWTQENLELNGLWGPRHELIRSDVTRWCAQERGRLYDLIVLDPPSFSASKKMAETFDIQRDHVRLLDDVLALLAPGGALYFSTNFTGFQLDDRALPAFRFAEITPASIPDDIRNRKVHRCWRITRR